MRLWRQLDEDRVAGAHLAAGDDHAHDAGLANQVAVLVTVEGRSHQPALDAVQLGAGVAQTGHLDDRAVAETQPGAGRQSEQIDAARCDVLAHLAGHDGKARVPQLVVQFAVNQMDLT